MSFQNNVPVFQLNTLTSLRCLEKVALSKELFFHGERCQAAKTETEPELDHRPGIKLQPGVKLTVNHMQHHL